MGLKTSGIIAVLLAGTALFIQGCSGTSAGAGTKITLSIPAKGASRENISAACKYLSRRGNRKLGVKKAYVDSMTADSMVFLLPGKKATKGEVYRLLQTSSIELFYLKNLATKSYPNRPWTMKIRSDDGPILFLGPDAKRIDGSKDSADLLREIADYPKEKPILSGKNILPNAAIRAVKSGWAVLIQFDKDGAETFYEFTKSHPGENLAVFCNGDLVSAPGIEKPVEGGKVYITGFKSADDAQAAVDDINGGNLPLDLKVKSVEYY